MMCLMIKVIQVLGKYDFKIKGIYILHASK